MVPTHDLSGRALPAPDTTSGAVPNAAVVNLYGPDGHIVDIGRCRRQPEAHSGGFEITGVTGDTEFVPAGLPAGCKRSGVWIVYLSEES